MARVAYVDHSYHRKTRSTLFLPELLAGRGHEVETFWDAAWIGGEPVRWDTVSGHDVVVMFQSHCTIGARTFRELHENVVYVPMFDQFGFPHRPPSNLSAFWAPFQQSKVLSFSTSVHTLATGFGIASHLVRYFPEVPQTSGNPSAGLHGFFWLRREGELDWGTVRSLIGPTRFDSFHLHVVGDPGFPPVQLPPREELDALQVTTSSWFDRRADFEEVVSRANVYFAPRLAEGIGQTFLEAMARGQCVVAADSPTMNEYIVHGVNGLLFDPRSPKPLDFSDAARLGQEARRGMSEGRRRWERSEERLVQFILAPSSALYGEVVDGAAAPRTGGSTGRFGENVTHAMRSVLRAVRTAVDKGRL